MQVPLIKKDYSAFSRRYSPEIKRWALNFDLYPSPILSISRKGPRLFELLYQDGLIDKSVLDRTCSEYAIPFLRRLTNLSVVDDSVLYGSTLKDTIDIIKNKLFLKDSDVCIAPLRYSVNAPEQIKLLINKDFSVPISPSDSPVHINQLIQSFKRLGKPYDLEFPILYLTGDFSNCESFKETLELVCKDIGDSKLITNGTPNYPDRYTILVRGLNARTPEAGAEFSKIRIYVRDDYKQIAITPISPCIISNEDLLSFHKTISPKYQSLWSDVLSKLSNSSLDEYDYRTLIVWANYLKSLSFLSKRLIHFENHFDISKLKFDAYDIRLILGFELPDKIISILSEIITEKNKFVFFEQNYKHFYNINEFKIPTDRKDSFLNCFKGELDVLKDINSESEIINHFFHCQHTKIELSTRLGDNYNSIKRLKFGFTLNYIIDLVNQHIKDASIVNIHSAFDKLIDQGAIVPKYLDLSNESNKTIWGRVYRIGEGGLPTSQKILAILIIFENLKNKFKSEFIPAVVLEKCTVLGLTSSFNFKELNEDGITGLGIKKKFGQYGARCYITTDANGSGAYLLDWAKSLRILKQSHNDEYFINEPVAKTYNLNEASISSTAKDKLEDIAHFCHFISKKQNENALVLFTTLASKKEFWLAISAELDLWLNHPSSGIYNCFNKLGEIRNSQNSNNSTLLNECNELLSNNANYTAQVATKTKLFTNYNEIVAGTDKLISEADNPNITRVWRDIKEYLTLSNNDSSGNYNTQEIITTLRISHLVTSLCRNLLNKAGFKASHGQQKTISYYLKLILETFENSKTNTFLIWHTFEENGIISTLRNTIIKYDDSKLFTESFDVLKPILIEISDTIYNIFNTLGTIHSKSHPTITLPPPIYIVMWDVRDSTNVENRLNLEQTVILPINEQIRNLLSKKNTEWSAAVNVNDGNSFLTPKFSDVLMAFSLITKKANEHGVSIRVGCDVNYEGDLHIYTEKKIIGGRAYEYADRTTNFFKEISKDPTRWEGDPISEPIETYLILSEFVKRIAEKNNEWSLASFQEYQVSGYYSPRVKKGTCIPYQISLLLSH